MIPDQAFCIKAPEGPPLEDRFPYYPDRIVIQALIDLGNGPLWIDHLLAGAVVKLMGRNLYKTHRILMPDGSTFEYNDKNAELTPVRGVAPKSSYASRISTAFDTSISGSDGSFKL